MDKLKVVYIEFIRDFHKVFFPRSNEAYDQILFNDDDLPRFNKFSEKWHTLITTENRARFKEPHLIKRESSEGYKIAGVNWLYHHALPAYVKTCMVIEGTVDTAFLGPMPISWRRPTSSSLAPPEPKTEPESASPLGSPTADKTLC